MQWQIYWRIKEKSIDTMHYTNTIVQKRIKTTKVEDQLTALNKQFQTSSYLDNSSLKKLITETKLTKTYIQD